MPSTIKLPIAEKIFTSEIHIPEEAQTQWCGFDDSIRHHNRDEGSFKRTLVQQ
jgi:hypothetical protein